MGMDRHLKKGQEILPESIKSLCNNADVEVLIPPPCLDDFISHKDKMMKNQRYSFVTLYSSMAALLFVFLQYHRIKSPAVCNF